MDRKATNQILSELMEDLFMTDIIPQQENEETINSDEEDL